MSTELSYLSKLQQESLRVDNGGLLNLPWKIDPTNPFALPELDLNWLIGQPLLPVLVQVIPSQSLYHAMVSHGIEDCLEVVEWIRGHQLHQILDFDLWGFDHANEVQMVQADKVKTWFRLWLEIGPEFAAARVFELEEDLVVTLFSSIFEIHPDEFTKKAEWITDDYYTTPDRKFHIKLFDNDPEFWEVCYQMIMAMYAKDVRGASQTFAYAAMLVRQEHLASELRWRAGRLADQGFVDKETAISMLKPRTGSEVEKEIKKIAASFYQRSAEEAARQEKFAKTQSAYALEVDPEVFDGIVHILKEMDVAEATKIIQYVLPQKDIQLLSGSHDPRPEDLVEEPDVIQETVERAVAQGRALLGASFSLHFRNEKNVKLLVEKAFQLLAESSLKEDETFLFSLKGRIARSANALSTALNSGEAFTSEIASRSLEIVRGCLNIGLELILSSSGIYGIELELTEFDEVNAAQILRVVGPEAVFHLGWSKVKGISQHLADTVVDLYILSPLIFSSFKPERNVRMQDGNSIKVTIDGLVRAGRYSDVRKWLGEIESELDGQIFWALSALLNRVPLFGPCFHWEAKNSDALKASLSRELRAFSSLNEVTIAEGFVADLAKIMKGNK